MGDDHVTNEQDVGAKDGEQDAGMDELVFLQEQVEALRSEATENLDKYRRAMAEFSNYRKRQERDREQQTVRLKMDVLRQLLPLLDDFGRAMEIMPEELSGGSWAQGIELIERKLRNILDSAGVEPIEALGKPFDPTYHAALMQMESDEYPAGTVMFVLEKGYLLQGQVLRPARVQVSSGPAENQEAS